MQSTPPTGRHRITAAVARRPASMSLAVGVACLAVLTAGCGSASPTSSSAQPPAPKSIADAAFKYASCMRTHGVPNFPDPQVVNTPNAQGIRLMVPGSLAGTPGFKTAQKACRSIMPGPGNVSPAQLAQQQHVREQDLVAFARCLRTHGVSNFPDPTPQGRLTIQMVTAAGVDLHAPNVLTAAKACIGAARGAITAADVAQATGGGQ